MSGRRSARGTQSCRIDKSARPSGAQQVPSVGATAAGLFSLYSLASHWDRTKGPSRGCSSAVVVDVSPSHFAFSFMSCASRSIRRTCCANRLHHRPATSSSRLPPRRPGAGEASWV